MNTNHQNPNSKLKYVVGVDVGGTFTDLFILNELDGTAKVIKVPSTRGEESLGFMNAISQVDHHAADIKTIVHGTTVATNALLERKVAKAGMLTTRGFKDVLEMRRRDRPQTWGLRGTFEPIIPRTLRLEVSERILSDGTVHTPLDESEVVDGVKKLIAMGCESICIFYINAYANPVHEIQTLKIIKDIWPNGHITIASEVLPEIREFERCSTAALNASLQPVVGNYLEKLTTQLQIQGFLGELLIVQSNGGVMSGDAAIETPIKTALSGPAAGVIACASIAKVAGFTKVITGDMGGTSFDVSLIDHGTASLAPQTEIDFGLVIRSPMIQIETIGAGGGSIASVDASMMLQVGPQSAGSKPGPACYGLGGIYPTVTDANVVLGRIACNRPLGGGMLKPLHLDLAIEAIDRYIAKPLNLSVIEAAQAILSVANSKMAGAIRLVSIEKGYDPREFVYMPFGGGGSLHVCAIMREVDAKMSLIPRFPGVTSALGCVIADMRYDMVQTLNIQLDQFDAQWVIELIEEMQKRCAEKLKASGVAFSVIDEALIFDMLYAGQTHTLSVPISFEVINQQALSEEALTKAFQASYQSSFGRTLEGLAIKVLNVRYTQIGVRPKFDMKKLAPVGTYPVDSQQIGTQEVYHLNEKIVATRYARLNLSINTVVKGPAIFEQPDTTVWLEPGFQALVDEFGNLLISQINV